MGVAENIASRKALESSIEEITDLVFGEATSLRNQHGEECGVKFFRTIRDRFAQICPDEPTGIEPPVKEPVRAEPEAERDYQEWEYCPEGYVMATIDATAGRKTEKAIGFFRGTVGDPVWFWIPISQMCEGQDVEEAEYVYQWPVKKWICDEKELEYEEND